MRTNVTQIKAVLDTSLSDSNIVTHINIANRIVTDKLSAEGYSNDKLTDIETYLTAHLIAIGKERQAMNEQIGDVRVTYQGKFGEALRTTTYGQMVLSLDDSGKMANLGTGKAKIRAIGQVDND